MKKFVRIQAWTIGLLLGFVSLTAQGQVTWDNDAGDGLWSSPTNWSTDAVPGDDDDVEINGNYAVTINATDSCRSLRIIGENNNSRAVSLTITSGARLGIRDSLKMDDRNKNNNTNILTISNGSTLLVGASMVMTKDGSSQTNNDMQVILNGDNSHLNVIGTLVMTLTSNSNNSNDMGLVLTEDSRVDCDSLRMTLGGNREGNTLFSLNAGGAAGDSAVIDVTTDFAVTAPSGSQDFVVDMDYESRINVGNNFSYVAAGGNAFELYLDRDAAIDVTGTWTMTKDGNQEVYYHFNQNALGSAADAQLTIGGDATLAQTDGDAFEWLMNGDADVTIGGNLNLSRSGIDDNGDHFTWTLNDTNKVDVAGGVEFSFSSTRNTDLFIDIFGNSEIECTTDFGITLANDDQTIIDIANNGVFDVGGSFTFDNTGSSNEFELDMDDNAVMTVGGSMTVQQDDDNNLEFFLDGDAALSVTSDLSLTFTNDDNILVYLNNNIDGSAADAQLTVGGDFNITKTNGDEIQIYLRQHSDLLVTGDIQFNVSNSDGNDDFVRFDLEDQSLVSVGDSLIYIAVENNRDPEYDLLMDGSAQMTVTNAIYNNWTGGGDINVTMNDNTVLTMGGSWYSNVPASKDLVLTMNNSADVNIGDDFVYNNTSSGDLFFIDMDNVATLDVTNDVIVYHHAGGNLAVNMDSDAAFTIGDSLFVTKENDASIIFNLNQTTDGSAADAQLNVGGSFYIDKNNGDEVRVYLDDHSDLIVGNQFVIETTNGDDNDDFVRFDLDDDAVVTITDSLLITMDENNKSLELDVFVSDNADMTIGRAWINNCSGGQFALTLEDNADLTITESWVSTMTGTNSNTLTLSNFADLDVGDDFTWSRTSGSDGFTLDMGNNATFDVVNDITITQNGSGGLFVYLDHDAALTMGDSLMLTQGGDGNTHVHLNNSVNGSSADAQITVPGSFYIDKNNGDDLEIYLRDGSDITITGQLRIETFNGDNNGDSVKIDLEDQSRLVIGDSLYWEMIENSKSPEAGMFISNNAQLNITRGFYMNNNSGETFMRVENNGVLDIGEGWNSTMSNSNEHWIVVNNSGDVNIGDDFRYVRSSGTGDLNIDLDNNATFDVTNDIYITHNSGGGSNITIDSDAALTVGDSLHLVHDGDGRTRLTLNDSTDGSAADAQLTIPGALYIDKNDGDEAQIYLRHNSDINVTGQVRLETFDGDDNDDELDIDLEDDSRFIIGDSLVITMVENSKSFDFQFAMNENSVMTIGKSLVFTSNAGNSTWTMGNSAQLNITENWNNSVSSSDAYDLTLSGSADLNITEDYNWIMSSGTADMDIDLTGNSTFDVGQDVTITHNANDRFRLQLDSNAAFTIADSLAVNRGGGGDGHLQIYLNTNNDGDLADAQLSAATLFLNKYDGDRFRIYLGNHSDITLTNDLVIQGTNTDDNDDNYQIWLWDDSRLTIGRDWTMAITETGSNPDVLIDVFGNAILGVTRDMTVTFNNAEHFDVDIDTSGQFNIGRDFVFTNTSSSGYFAWDMLTGANSTIGDDFKVTTLANGGSDTFTRLRIDGDATMSVGDSLYLDHTPNDNLQLRLNSQADGSANDAQLTVTGDLVMIHRDGDDMRFSLANDADVTVGGDMTFSFLDSDGTDDNSELDVNNDAKLDIEGSLFLTNTNTNTNDNNDLIIDLNDNGVLDVGPSGGPFTTDSMVVTHGGGDDFNIFLESNAVLNVFGTLRLNKTGGDDIVLDLNDASAVNISKNLVLDNDEGADLIRVDLVSTATLDVDCDIRFENGAVSGMHEVELNDNSKLEIAGNFVRQSSPNNYGVLDCNDAATVEFNGTAAQIFPQDAGAGTDVFDFRNVIINNSFGTAPQLTMEGLATVHTDITFTDGILQTTETNILVIDDGATSTGASDVSHVDGFTRKVGDEAYTFPVGDETRYLPISISAPASASDAFEAQYFRQDPDGLYPRNQKVAGLETISQNEYWILNRTGGSSAVTVTMTWDTGSGVNNLTDLRIARFDDTDNEWKDHGNGGTTGDSTAGTIVTAAVVTDFSPFTFASVSNTNNPLPIELIAFNAELEDEHVNLTWETATEINNDFFTIERSEDGEKIEAVAFVDGAGNSNTVLNYRTVDWEPMEGLSYYRLRQTDFNGTTTVSDWVSIEFQRGSTQAGETPAELEVVMYPNPATAGQQLIFDFEEVLTSSALQVTITDLLGTSHLNRNIGDLSGQNQLTIPLSASLAAGTYLVRLIDEEAITTRKLVVR